MKKEVIFMHNDADGWMSALLYGCLHEENEKIFIPINYGNEESKAFNSITLNEMEIEKIVFLDFIPSREKLNFLLTFNFKIEIYDHHKDNIKKLILNYNTIEDVEYLINASNEMEISDKCIIFWDLSQATCGYFSDLFKSFDLKMKNIVRLVSNRDLGMLWDDKTEYWHKNKMLEVNEVVYLAIDQIKHTYENETKTFLDSKDMNSFYDMIINFNASGIGEILRIRHENEVKEITRKSFTKMLYFKNKLLCFIQIGTIKHLSDVGNLIAKEDNCVCCCYYLTKYELVISFRDTKGIALETAKELAECFKEYVVSCGGHDKACGMAIKGISINTLLGKVEKYNEL